MKLLNPESQSKFHPPEKNQGYLIRKRLIPDFLGQSSEGGVILIEAGPGYGKTILASHIAERFGKDFIWYQLDIDDRDPSRFLMLLLQQLQATISLHCPILEDLLQHGEISAQDLSTPIRLLSNCLKKEIKRHLCLILDDVHILLDSPYSLAFLNHLLDLTQSGLTLVITTRRSIFSNAVPEPISLVKYKVDERLLAFTLEEICNYHETVLSSALNSNQLHQIYQKTEGWAAAVALTGDFLDNKGPSSWSKLEEYIQNIVFSSLNYRDQCFLTKIALIDQVNLKLLNHFWDEIDAKKKLEGLARKNRLIRRHRNNQFSLHPVLKQYLKNHASSILGHTEYQKFNTELSDIYQHSGQITNAIRSSISAEDYPTAEKLLTNHGIDLYNKGQYVLLAQILDEFPKEIIEKSGWLSLLHGAVLMELKPINAFQPLDRAISIFNSQHEVLGELLTLSVLIFFYGSILATYEQARHIYQRALNLFEQLEKQIPATLKLQICTSLAAGSMFLDADLKHSTHYLKQALEIAHTAGFINKTIRLLYLQFYISMATGNYNEAESTLEKLHQLSQQPGVDIINQSFCLCAKLNYLAIKGMHKDFERELNSLYIEKIQNILSNSTIGAFIQRWKADLLISQGRYDEASELMEYRSFSKAETSDHMRSQFLQNLAISQAITNKREEAISNAKLSLELRSIAGEKNQSIYNFLAVGITYLILQKSPEAEKYLTKALLLAQDIGKSYVESSARFYLALLYIRNSKTNNYKEQIHEFYKITKRTKEDYFYYFIPDLAKELFSQCVIRGIHTELIRKLSAKLLDQGISDDGKFFPVLHIETQRQLSLRIAGDTVLRCEDMTQNQRNLLALLICQPKLQIGVHDLQTTLWVDTPLEKSRPRLDTLLRRMRKTITDSISPHNIDNYIITRKGVIMLNNCTVDLQDFNSNARKGLELIYKGRPWLSRVYLSRAFQMFKGKITPNTAGFYDLNDYRNSSYQTYLRISLSLASLYRKEGMHEDAEHTLKIALSIAPWDEDLTRELYQLYTQKGQPIKANKVINDFKYQLKADGYTKEEIENALWAIRTS